MIYLMYHAAPLRAPIEANDFAGAYITCWINTDRFVTAQELATAFIEMNEWAVIELEDMKVVTKDDYNTLDEDYHYFEQALENEEVYVFHTYPLIEIDRINA